MTLEELKQVKKDLDNGIIISKATWARILDQAIDNEDRLNIIAEEFDTIVEVDAWDEHGNDLHINFDVVRMQLK